MNDVYSELFQPPLRLPVQHGQRHLIVHIADINAFYAYDGKLAHVDVALVVGPHEHYVVVVVTAQNLGAAAQHAPDTVHHGVGVVRNQQQRLFAVGVVLLYHLPHVLSVLF